MTVVLQNAPAPEIFEIVSQGPQGPAGPQGPQGIQGPVGDITPALQGLHDAALLARDEALNAQTASEVAQGIAESQAALTVTKTAEASDAATVATQKLSEVLTAAEDVAADLVLVTQLRNETVTHAGIASDKATVAISNAEQAVISKLSAEAAANTATQKATLALDASVQAGIYREAVATDLTAARAAKDAVVLANQQIQTEFATVQAAVSEVQGYAFTAQSNANKTVLDVAAAQAAQQAAEMAAISAETKLNEVNLSAAATAASKQAAEDSALLALSYVEHNQTLTSPFIQMATDLIKTQAIITENHGFN